MLSMIVVVTVLVGCGSTRSATVQPAPKRLSDNYAISALLALKAIEGDTYVPEKGSNLVSRFTQEKIDAADVTAVSPEERNMTALLNNVYHERLSLNSDKAKLNQDSREWLEVSTRLSKKTNDELIDKFTESGKSIKARESQLDSCFADFDTSLRARSVDTPASCK